MLVPNKISYLILSINAIFAHKGLNVFKVFASKIYKCEKAFLNHDRITCLEKLVLCIIMTLNLKILYYISISKFLAVYICRLFYSTYKHAKIITYIFYLFDIYRGSRKNMMQVSDLLIFVTLPLSYAINK